MKTVSAIHALRLVLLLTAGMACVVPGRAQLPVTETNVVVRVAAANISTGNNQRYEAPGLRIFQGLKPDIVAIQEFSYASTNGAGINTPAAFREMIDSAFGTNFHYFRESGAGYTIPNGVISRWPIVQSAGWVDSDTGVNDRGYAWARIDLPGTNDLYVVSVHLKASSTASDESRRAAEAAELKDLISTNFPPGAWIIVAGDMNLYSDTEPAILTFNTFLSDSPVPADQNGVGETNAGRSERYDRVLVSFSMTNRLVPIVMPSRTYPNGLVFDSRVYTPLSEVSPVLSTDSAAPMMQHMAVVKDFRVPFTVTNLAALPAPRLTQFSPHVLRWTGPSNLAYTVQAAVTLTNWVNAGAATSTTTNYAFTNTVPSARRFFRVRFP